MALLSSVPSQGAHRQRQWIVSGSGAIAEFAKLQSAANRFLLSVQQGSTKQAISFFAPVVTLQQTVNAGQDGPAIGEYAFFVPPFLLQKTISSAGDGLVEITVTTRGTYKKSHPTDPGVSEAVARFSSYLGRHLRKGNFGGMDIEGAGSRASLGIHFVSNINCNINWSLSYGAWQIREISFEIRG